ncbi:MAG: UvrB/UvrC motif-containing protein, partial [Propionicimonas sp.]|nr:UvrB/UvrC motif-containing protein [Propionicimonas sp.]
TKAISETNRRRGVQEAHNLEHGIDPQTIIKPVTDILADLRGSSGETPVPGSGRRKQRPGEKARAEQFKDLPPSDLGRLISLLEDEMNAASVELRFEEAARLRDEIKDLRRELRNAGGL